MNGRVAVALVLGMLAAVAHAAGADWPQWGGPGRDFKAVPAGRIAASWPPDGPRELWSRPLGEGYSAIASDGTTLFTMYRPIKGLMTVLKERVWSPATSPEVVVAIDAASGRSFENTPSSTIILAPPRSPGGTPSSAG